MIEEDKGYHSHRSDYNDDEIDLYDILMKIWKWKYLISAIVVFSTFFTFLYFFIKPLSVIFPKPFITLPDTYSTEASMKIGKVSNVLIEQIKDVVIYSTSSEFRDKIEQPRDIKSYLKSLDFMVENYSDSSEISEITDFAESRGLIGFANLTESINLSDLEPYSLNIKDTDADSISICCSSYSPDISFACVNKAIDLITKRHEKVYKRAVKRIRENINLLKSKEIINPVLILDSYTYPTSVILRPELSEAFNGQLKKSPEAAGVNGWSSLPLKLAVVFTASLFFGIFLSLFVDYIISERDKRSTEQN